MSQDGAVQEGPNSNQRQVDVTVKHHLIGPLNELQTEIYKNAVDHGWYDKAPKMGDPGYLDFINSKLMLIVSEAAEACEELRKVKNHDALKNRYYEGQEADEAVVVKLPAKPEGFGVELADALIRILDLSAFCGIPLGEMVIEKHEFNKTRPYRHGHRNA